MTLLLLGPLAEPGLMAVLGVGGPQMRLPGRLLGGRGAGLGRDSWPHLAPGQEGVTGIAVEPSPGLRRYAQVMGLTPLEWCGHAVMGATRYLPDAPGAAVSGPDDLPWPGPTEQPALVAEIARQILAASGDVPASVLAHRLPMIGVWAASRLRAAAGPVSGQGVVPLRGADAVRIHDRGLRHAGFFALEELRLTHQRHDGDHSSVLRREGLLMGDAVVVLPWDPARDRVLVIEQFRLAPMLRGDPQPWLLEPIAGRADAGETVDEAARREAEEEAGLTVERLLPAFDSYPSPAAIGEFLFHFVAIADLPDNAAGIHGLEDEAEDIRGHLMRRSDLVRMVRARQITNAPLVALALWLELHARDMGMEPTGSRAGPQGASLGG